MSMNIKDPETHRLARELAERTGQTVTAAVKGAVQEKLERVRGAQEPSLTERILAITKGSAERFPEPYRSADHGDLLYDELGLPK